MSKPVETGGATGGGVSDKDLWGDAAGAGNPVEAELAGKTTAQIQNLTRMLETNIRVMNSEVTRLNHEVKAWKAKLKENQEKVKMNKQLPYLGNFFCIF
jgi:26S proteasome regulatory subunit T5